MPDITQSFLDEHGLSSLKKNMDSYYSNGLLFQIIIPRISWFNGESTVTDSRLLSAKEYVYFTSASKDSRNEYLFNGVHPKDIVENGSIEFISENIPGNDLAIDILRLKVR